MQVNMGGPAWVGDRIYFCSDHEGVGNVYSVGVDGDGTDLTAHTDHGLMYARNPATDGTTVVYQCGGDIYALDIKTGGVRCLEFEW